MDIERRHTGVTKLLLAHLPDFCWQTKDEVVTMMEAIYEDANPQTISVTLSMLASAERIEKRRMAKPLGTNANSVKLEYKAKSRRPFQKDPRGV